jgi:Ser/Thr protein kinase RdoA (MazF antagonist)
MRSLARPDESGRRWALETDRGRWAVRTMDTWIAIVDVETEVALQEAAAAAGVALPAPVRSRDGNIVESIDGHTWRAYEWLGSGPPLSAPASATVTAQVGAVFATLHGLALPVDRISPWHNMRFATMSWPELADAARAADAIWAPVLSDAVATLVELDDIGADASPPSPVLSHNSLGPGRARLGADGRLLVVGWEHAGGQPPAWELANALMDWAANPGGGINAAGARALAAGYRDVAGSLPALDLASFRGAVTSLANYVSGQVHVALDAKTDEDRRYADRNMRHLLTHLPTRSTLERLLDATEVAGRS